MSKKSHSRHNKPQATALNRPSFQKDSNKSTSNPLVDRSPRAQKAAQLQAIANNSPQIKKAAQLQKMANQPQNNNTNSPLNQPIQLKQGDVAQLETITVRNNTDSYLGDWLAAETQANGVEAGPQEEAQNVARLMGGYWVGGHMINDRLGGTGGFENIIPITGTMNNQHHAVENEAQRTVAQDGIEVRYGMEVSDRVNHTITDDSGNATGDEVRNLPHTFQPYYQWRQQAREAGGTMSRPIEARDVGDINEVQGQAMDMDLD